MSDLDRTTAGTIVRELRVHAPFTALGTVLGLVVVAAIVHRGLPRGVSAWLFWSFHPAHVFLSAWATAGIYRLHCRDRIWRTILIGYFGAIGIATLSDCIIPYVGELVLGLPSKGAHIGVVEKWWLVNPLAAAGIVVAFYMPGTRFPHAGHVLFSTSASLFHMTMALGTSADGAMLVLVAAFLFLAVWLPCCTSDILFPLLFRGRLDEDRAI